ncbi:MAG TPA: hypothetical protein VL400_03660, partial [Polyangiaceae bacterium]|nr:hypothetical protein [Polyangiaceae bacterium]
MATPDSLAKTAREKLAAALNALQTSSDAPVFLLDLAEPIAQSMAILHKIERSKGADLTGKEVVATNVRAVLDKLQSAPESHSAVDQVMEFIAGSLSSVHQLSRATPAAAPAPAPAPGPAPAPAPAAPAPAPPGFPAPPAFSAAAPGVSAAQPAFPQSAPAPAVNTFPGAGPTAAAVAAPPSGQRPPNQTVRMQQSPAIAAAAAQA